MTVSAACAALSRSKGLLPFLGRSPIHRPRDDGLVLVSAHFANSEGMESAQALSSLTAHLLHLFFPFFHPKH